ncbi:predicted protein, partial [Nematostella vectensis]
PQFIDLMQPVEVTEGQTATFECTVKGYPRPSIEWFKNGLPLKENERIASTYEGALSSLTINQCTIDDEGNYKCVARNSFGKASCATELLTNLNGTHTHPPHFIDKHFETAPAEVTEEGDVRLEVRVGGHPKPSVQWLKDDEVIISSPHFMVSSHADVHTLVINSPNQDDIGQYKVIASNHRGMASRTFDVNVEGKPKPSVEWLKDDRPVLSDSHIKMTEEDDIYSLTIREPTKSDEGMYTVKITNDVGSGTRTFDVKVEDTTTNDSFVPFESTEEGNVRLSVKITGKPVPEVSWTKDEKPVHKIQNIRLDHQDDIYTLTIREATPNDSGSYKCTLTNDAGKSTRTFSVEIEGETKPEKGKPTEREGKPLEEEELPVSAETEVEMTAQVTGKPQPSVEWFKDDVPVSPDEHITITEEDGTYSLVIKEPTKKDEGTYTVEVSNEAGLGRRTFDVSVDDTRKTIPKDAVKPKFIEDGSFVPFQSTDEGDVRLTVKVTGKPEPEVTWTKDGKPVDKLPNVELDHQEDRYILTIREASPDDSGSYRCTLTSDVGKS